MITGPWLLIWGGALLLASPAVVFWRERGGDDGDLIAWLAGKALDQQLAIRMSILIGIALVTTGLALLAGLKAGLKVGLG